MRIPHVEIAVRLLLSIPSVLILAACVSPARADLASLIEGRTAYEAIRDARVVEALSDVMSEEAFREARELAENGTSAPATESDGVVSTFACEPGACGYHEMRLAVDHEGRAWASLTVDGETSFYGNPNAEIRELLEPPR